MEINELIEFQDKLRKLTVNELTDRDFNKEILKCSILIKDISNIMKFKEELKESKCHDMEL